MSIHSGGSHFEHPGDAGRMPGEQEADLKGNVEKAKMQAEKLIHDTPQFRQLLKVVTKSSEQKTLEEAAEALSNQGEEEEQPPKEPGKTKQQASKPTTPHAQQSVPKQQAKMSRQGEKSPSSSTKPSSPHPESSKSSSRPNSSPQQTSAKTPSSQTNTQTTKPQHTPSQQSQASSSQPSSSQKPQTSGASKQPPPSTPKQETNRPADSQPTTNKQSSTKEEPTKTSQPAKTETPSSQEKPSTNQQEKAASQSSTKQAQETKQQSQTPQAPRSQAQVKSQGGAQQAQAPARNAEAQQMGKEAPKAHDTAQQAANMAQGNTMAASQQQTTNKLHSPNQSKRSDGKQEAQEATGLRASQVVAGTGQSDTNSDSEGNQQGKQQADEAISSTSQPSKGGAEELYGSKYKLRTSDTMDAEFLAMGASYEADKVKKDYESHEHKLEAKAQEYAQYVSEYMQGVQGYTMHAFQGGFSFSNDMTHNKPTSAYQNYLDKVQYYKDRYLAAENVLAQYEPQVQQDYGSYRMAYDQYEMMYSINKVMMSAYNSINFSSWNKKIHDGEATVQKAAQAIEKELNSLISQLEGEKDKKGKPIPGAQEAAKALQGIEDNLKGTLSGGGSINVSSILSQIESALKKAGSDLPSSLSSILDTCKGLLNSYQGDVNQVASLKSTLRQKLQGAFQQIENTISEDLQQLSSDNKKFASSLGYKQNSGNPFLQEEGILKNLLNKTKGLAEGGSIQALESGLSGLNKYGKQSQSKLEHSKAKQTYQSAYNTYKSELQVIAKYSAQAVQAKNALNQYEKNNEPPPDKRWSSVSDYGYATLALDQYKRLVNEVNFNPSGSAQFSQTVSKGPRKVDGSPIPEWWNIKNKRWDNLKALERKINDLKNEKTALIIATAASCGLNVAADVLLALVSGELSSDEDALGGVKDAYNSAKETYMNYQHQLPAQQQANNSSWKSQLTQKAQALSQQFNKQVAQTRLREQQAEKSVKKEVQNIQKIMDTFTQLAANKAQATTQSFL